MYVDKALARIIYHFKFTYCVCNLWWGVLAVGSPPSLLKNFSVSPLVRWKTIDNPLIVPQYVWPSNQGCYFAHETSHWIKNFENICIWLKSRQGYQSNAWTVVWLKPLHADEMTLLTNQNLKRNYNNNPNSNHHLTPKISSVTKHDLYQTEL